MTQASLSLNTPRHAQRALEEMYDAPVDQTSPSKMGEILIRLGFLKEKQIRRVLAEQTKNGGQFGEIALRLKYINHDHIHMALAIQYGYLRNTAKPAALPKGLVVIRNPNSEAAAKIRLLRTRILTTKKEDQLGAFSIASTGYNVKAEYLASNLAVSFAQLRRRVLLIDADLINPKINRFFRLPTRPGLCEILDGRAELGDVDLDCAIKNLSILSAGPRRFNPHELLAGDRFKSLLHQTKSAFDIVMVMTSPGGGDGDAQYVWAATGAALVTARRDVSRRKELKSLSATLRQLDVDVIGAAMTR